MADIRHAIILNPAAEKVGSLCCAAKGLSIGGRKTALKKGKDGSVELGPFSKRTVYRLRPRRTTAAKIIWACDGRNARFHACLTIGFNKEKKTWKQQHRKKT